jgi:hypothetical protein
MLGKTRKIAWILLSLIFACLILFAILLFCKYADLSLRVSFAQEQVRIFDEMRRQAREDDISHAVERLEYAWHYYPTGTKQVAGSSLNDIVETSRKMAAEDILAILRQKSGKDFGNDPDAWLRNRDRLK